jgi:hypothetical protein
LQLKQQQQQQHPEVQLALLLGNAAGLRQAAARPQQPGELPARLQGLLRLALHQQIQCSQAAVSKLAAAEGQLAVPLFLQLLHSGQLLQQQLHLLLPWIRWRRCWRVAVALFAAGC